MAKKSRVAARKVKDKWKAKNWYNLIAPTMFNKAMIGETLADDPELLMGRISEVTVQDLTGDFSKMHIKLAFKIQDVRGNDAHTQFVGHDLTSDYVRRLTRRKKTRTDTTLDITTTDGTRLKVKPMAIADRRIQSSKQTAIREIMTRVVHKAAKEKTIGEFIKAIISGELAKNIAVSCKPIQPMQRVEIRKSEVLVFGEPPEEPEEEPEPEPEEAPVEELPVEAPPEETPEEEVAEEVPEAPVEEPAPEVEEEAPEEPPEEPVPEVEEADEPEEPEATPEPEEPEKPVEPSEEEIETKPEEDSEPASDLGASWKSGGRGFKPRPRHCCLVLVRAGKQA
jgi:small subunit ribosomal protein S3Ae